VIEQNEFLSILDTRRSILDENLHWGHPMVEYPKSRIEETK